MDEKERIPVVVTDLDLRFERMVELMFKLIGAAIFAVLAIAIIIVGLGLVAMVVLAGLGRAFG